MRNCSSAIKPVRQVDSQRVGLCSCFNDKRGSLSQPCRGPSLAAALLYPLPYLGGLRQNTALAGDSKAITEVVHNQ